MRAAIVKDKGLVGVAFGGRLGPFQALLGGGGSAAVPKRWFSCLQPRHLSPVPAGAPPPAAPESIRELAEGISVSPRPPGWPLTSPAGSTTLRPPRCPAAARPSPESPALPGAPGRCCHPASARRQGARRSPEHRSRQPPFPRLALAFLRRGLINKSGEEEEEGKVAICQGKGANGVAACCSAGNYTAAGNLCREPPPSRGT